VWWLPTGIWCSKKTKTTINLCAAAAILEKATAMKTKTTCAGNNKKIKNQQ